MPEVVDGKVIPCDRLFEGFEVGISSGVYSRFGFEEVTYLLLFGELPTAEQLRVLMRYWLKRVLPRILCGYYYESHQPRYDEPSFKVC